MSVSDDGNVADLTLAQLRGLRRENAAVLEHIARLFENQNRLMTSFLSFQEEVRDSFRNVRADINALKSDVLLLEGQNASRHGEVLNIMRRLDERDGPDEPI